MNDQISNSHFFIICFLYKILGYARGLIVLWDRKEAKADKTFYANQQLESVSVKSDGSQFISAHNDGSYIMWSLTGSTEALEPPNTPYGPYPCKAITKIYWNQDTDGDTWTVFRDDLSLRQERLKIFICKFLKNSVK